MRKRIGKTSGRAVRTTYRARFHGQGRSCRKKFHEFPFDSGGAGNEHVQ